MKVAKQVVLLWQHFSKKRKLQLAFLTVLMVISSFAEVISIGAVIPFVGVLIAPEKIFSHENIEPFLMADQQNSLYQTPFVVTLIFATAVIFAGIARVALLWLQTRVGMLIGADLSVKAFERVLMQPYEMHLSRSNGEVIVGTQKAKDLVAYIIQPMLILISSSFILIAILVTLFLINAKIASMAFLIFSTLYLLIIKLTKIKIKNNSFIISCSRLRAHKIIEESLGSIRELCLGKKHNVYIRVYRDAILPQQLASASNQAVGVTPRVLVETIGLLLITGLAYYLVEGAEIADGVVVIPIIGAIVLGAQRVLPLMQQIYNAYITIKGSQASINDALDLLGPPDTLSLPKKIVTPIPFQKEIKVDKISFRYSDNHPFIFRNISLNIPKGSRVGLVGPSGVGKSTFMDIFMGLLRPSEGTILIDYTPINKKTVAEWQACLSHVPQYVYLSDDTLERNIAFGVEENQIDAQKVIEAARKAEIAEFIEGLRDKYKTKVGERGIRLSVGQRQRIGIARALYQNLDVLILDEATASLDDETETKIIEHLEELNDNVTIIFITHKLSTLKKCDLIFSLSSNGLKTERKSN